MPELPEVETTRRGIAPLVVGRKVRNVVVRQRRLRWPVPRRLEGELPGNTIDAIDRRAKYLLFRTAAGTMLLHLGMSGSLRVVPTGAAAETHDHFELALSDGQSLRLRDPRRFGSVHWTRRNPLQHPLLRWLGPEPLTEEFQGDLLFRTAQGRSVAVKSFLMDSRVVVGVGNIYANEALFRAGVSPVRAAGKVSRARYEVLADAVKSVLSDSLKVGGTSLKDFQTNGFPGYYKLALNVYGRTGEPCARCGSPIRERRVGQRSTFSCGRCQR